MEITDQAIQDLACRHAEYLVANGLKLKHESVIAFSKELIALAQKAEQEVNGELVYQVWRSTDSCMEFYSWDDCDKEDYDRAHPTARRIIKIIEGAT